MATPRDIAAETVSRGSCVGCGVCAVVCPVGAISMRFDSRRGMPVPAIDGNKCVRCGRCAKTCGRSAGNLAALCRRVSSAPVPERVGLEGARGFLAWDPRPGRAKSVSGGGVTAIARELLRQDRIAGVVHAERVAAKRGEPHYRAVLSRTPDEVDSRRGSAYEPLDFSKVLAALDPSATYLVVGTPCAVRNFKALETVPGAPRPKFLACALVCSHNVTTQFADFMADRVGIPRDKPFRYDPRDKDGIPDAGNYNTRFDGESGTLYKENRFASGWTKYWRGYAFALSACCRCPDFWGMEADLSVKDAWGHGEWTSDPLGKSIAVFRNPDILAVAKSAGLQMRELAPDEYADTQRPQTLFKQRAAREKLERPIFSTTNFCNGLARTAACAAASRWTYRNFGKNATAAIFFLVGKSFGLLSRAARIGRRVGNAFRIQKRAKTILVVGGYGYGNVGDEAQCATTLRLLSDRYPDYQVRNLSPNPDYSHGAHPAFSHDFASRTMFFNHGCTPNVFDGLSGWKTVLFLWTMALVRFNAFFVKHNLPTWFINARKAWMLQELAQSSMLFFCGGGYLTGATRSRLWDGALLCRLCHVFGVPVAMSGQTIGVWPRRLDRAIARWGFRHVDIITTRDDEASVADLKAIGFPGTCFPTHDDALFCEKSAERQIAHADYVGFNFHFWGMDENERSAVLDKMHEAVAAVKASLPGHAAVFLPMTPTDMEAFRAFSRKHPGDGLEAFEYDYDFRKLRRAVADARLVVTMKHHPIIFAVGEDVPVVSLAHSPYYEHKNRGALGQYGVEELSVDLESGSWSNAFFDALAKVLKPGWFQPTVQSAKAALRARENRFFAEMDHILR